MGPFADLPAEVLDLVVAHLDQVGGHPQLYTVACAAQTLAALSQVCRGTRALAQSRLLSLGSTPGHEIAPCPVTCFPYVWGMQESSCDRGRGVFTLSKHGRPLDWAVVAQEVWRWPDSQVNVDADVWQACLHSLGLGPSKGGRGPEGPERALPEHMRTLQALLPRPEHLKHAPVPLGFIVEVRRLLCRAIPAREALRTYHLSAGDLDRLPIYKAPVLPQDRPRKPSGKKHMYRLIDVVRAARAKHGTAERMHACLHVKAASAKLHALTRLAAGSRAEARKEAEGRLEMMLRKERLSSSLSPLLRESFLQNVCSRAQSSGQAGEAGSLEHLIPAQLQLCKEQLQRRTFLMKQCSAETRLALAACDWAAEKSQGKDIGRLLAMAASLEQAAVKEWLGSLSDPSDALGIDKLPESVLAEVQQHLSSLTLVPSPEIAS
ncbi:g13128 [Coccomyxa viridis]|uniref:G13128 protein n=1 Tax=Coccomyxa viridis TaxID=1274662 RepID=A0ABP1GC21_9CHLO